MKEIKDSSLKAALDYRRVLFSPLPADYRHSINGLSKLVTEQTGEQPKVTEAYVFTVKGKTRIKILLPDEGMSMVYDIEGDRAREITRTCTMNA